MWLLLDWNENLYLHQAFAYKTRTNPNLGNTINKCQFKNFLEDDIYFIVTMLFCLKVCGGLLVTCIHSFIVNKSKINIL